MVQLRSDRPHLPVRPPGPGRPAQRPRRGSRCVGDDRQSDTQALSHKIVCEWLPAHSNRRAVSDAPSTDIAHHRALTRIAPTPARSHAGTQFYLRIQLSAMSSAEIAEYRSPVVIISFLSRTETHASVSACLRRRIRSILSPQTPK